MDQQAEADFRDFVVASWDSLLRSAYLLTGDPGTAERLVKAAVARVHRRWHRVDGAEAAAIAARTALVDLSASRWSRQGAAGEGRGELLDEAAGRDSGEELWQAVLALPPRERAALVLSYFEDLPQDDVARVLGCSPYAAHQLTSDALDRLRGVLDPAPLVIERESAP